MIITEWQSVSPLRMAPLFEIERQRWLSNLHWDCTATLGDIEAARIDGRLPGFVAIENDAIIGWSYHLVHRDALHIGGLTAPSPDVTAALLDATLKSEEASHARTTVVFGYFDAPGFQQALIDRGLPIEAYRYLVRPIDGPQPAGDHDHIESYSFGESADIAQLFQRAYSSAPAPRPFARAGHPDEWMEYVTQLTYSRGCGKFDARTSMVARDESDRVIGAALVSRIADDTVHLTQVAIDPASQGRGLGHQLLEHVMRESSRSRARRITLLVADSSDARRFYERLQFVEAGQFVMAASAA